MRREFTVAIVAWAGCLAAACSSGRHLDVCELEQDCTPPLECVQPVIVQGTTGCITQGLGGYERRACHRRCAVNSDCDVLGPDFGCVSLGCDGSDRVCLRHDRAAAPTQPPAG